MLAAPTGRAAKRLSEATGCTAKTIHRLLEVNSQTGGFQKNEDMPLDAQVFIIDEASMIDISLMHHLLKAIPVTAKLILVGDVNQLPSVGPGSVLRDIIESGVIPVLHLDEIFRQAMGSQIVVIAHKINQGIIPELSNSGQGRDFYFIEQENPELIPDHILSLVKDQIPQRFGFNPVNDIQVLTPMHKGSAGTINLNARLQEALNPSSKRVDIGNKTFRVNDKVMQIVNNYDKNVFNGDIGRISIIDRENQELSVQFDDRIVKYEYSDLDDLTLAYAVTVHKSQGAEYPVVVMPVIMQHSIMLQRKLLYTGVTRGKKLVVIVGSKRAMATAVNNNNTQMRYSLLKHRLQTQQKA